MMLQAFIDLRIKREIEEQGYSDLVISGLTTRIFPDGTSMISPTSNKKLVQPTVLIYNTNITIH